MTKELAREPPAAVNVEGGSCNFHHFHQENIEHSLAKLTHAQQAIETASYILGSPQLRDGKPSLSLRMKVTNKQHW